MLSIYFCSGLFFPKRIQFELISEYLAFFLAKHLLPGVEPLGRGVDHPPLTRTKVKERVELHFFSISRPSWPVTGRFCFTFTLLRC
jgi:hypothetical protein